MGRIIGGIYYKNAAGNELCSNSGIAGIAKAGAQDEMRRQYSHDIIQPRLANGQPNPDFIDFYPKESKEYGFVREEKNENINRV